MTEGRWRCAVTILLLILVAHSCWLAYEFPSWSCEQLYLKQADAFLNGRLNIDARDLDTVAFEGKLYVPYPPSPSLAYVPLVVVFGAHIAVAYAFCSLLTVANVINLDAIGRQLGIDTADRWWLAIAFFFGTGYWFCLIYSYSAAYNSHIIVVTFLLAAIRESQRRARGWVLGLFFGMLCTTRPMTIFALPFLITAIWCRHRRGDRPTSLPWEFVAFGAAATPFLITTLFFNHFRFNDAFETGYSLTGGYDRRYGLFSLVYLPRSLYYMLLHGFTLNRHDVSEFWLNKLGTSLPHASPYLALVFFVSLRKPLVAAAWASAIPCGLAICMCAYVGSLQYNCQRYAFDFLPLLFFVAMIGFRSRSDAAEMRLWKTLICWAAGLNVFCFSIVPLVSPWWKGIVSTFTR